MTELLVPLITWSIPEDEEVRNRKSRTLRKQGWVGVRLNSPSPYERVAILAFLKTAYRNFYFPEINFVANDSLNGFGNADLPEGEIWFPAETDMQPLLDFLATIPPRTIEFSVSEITQEMERLLSGCNHLVVEYEDDVDFDTISYLISMEDQTNTVIHLKLLAA